MLFQNIERFCDISIFITYIKCEVYNFVGAFVTVLTVNIHSAIIFDECKFAWYWRLGVCFVVLAVPAQFRCCTAGKYEDG